MPDTLGDYWRGLLGHLKETPAVGMEIGAFKGETAVWMLSNIFTHPGVRYTVVDTFAGGAEHHVRGIDCTGLEASCRAALAPFPRARIIKGDSASVLRWVMPDSLDFVYVDAAHDAASVLRDGVLAFDLLKSGGVIVFDDYEWQDMPDRLDRPKLAIDAFLACYARKLDVISVGWRVAARKR
jgi:predicted O-methyltransferase YrrM